MQPRGSSSGSPVWGQARRETDRPIKKKTKNVFRVPGSVGGGGGGGVVEKRNGTERMARTESVPSERKQASVNNEMGFRVVRGDEDIGESEHYQIFN